MLSVLLAIVLYIPEGQKPEPTEVRILFLGNSHTTNSNVPWIVERLIESDGSGRKATVSSVKGEFLSTIYNRGSIKDKIMKGDWDYVVLQGQEISKSHKFSYSKTEAIALAKMAKSAGAKALLFAEWPREGIDESDYIYGIYEHIAKESGAEVVPVCYAFDEAREKDSSIELLLRDGNHASHFGGLLASLTIYYWISGTERDPDNLRGFSFDKQKLLRSAAKDTVNSYRKKAGATAARTRTRQGRSPARPSL